LTFSHIAQPGRFTVADVAGLAPFAPGNIAATWWLAGCAVVPIRTGGTKAPYVDWKQFQGDRANAGQVRTWFEQQFPGAGVAVICGAVSGNLEMLELEGRANNPESISKIEQACAAAGILPMWHWLLNNGYSEQTPSGGLHLLYRVTDNPVPGNTHIAKRWATDEEYTSHERELREKDPTKQFPRVLVETRGEGGYVVVAPTPGTCHASGRPWVTLTGTPSNLLGLNWAEREQLHQALRAALNEITTEVAVAVPQPRPPRPERPPGELTAVDDFNIRANWEEPWFTSHGWQVHHRSGNEIFWTRPGKELSEGHSASTGYSADGMARLFIWTTSTDLPAEQPLSKFFVHAHYNYNGDLNRCAKALRLQGWGTPLIQPPALGDFDLELGRGVQVAGEGGEPGPPQRHDLHSPEHLRPNGGLIYTDTGYARRMYDRFKDRFRYNSVEKRWYVWEPGASAWEARDACTVTAAAESIAEEAMRALDRELERGAGEERRGKLIEQLYKQALTAMSNARISALVNRFQNQPGITVDPDAFNNNTDLLNLGNCTYNLSTGVVANHSPDDMQTMTFGADYDPDAVCPRFERFMSEVLPDPEVRAYVQRALGYSLTGRPTKRVMFLLHGPSGTGKSVLTSVMTELFGGYGGTAPATTFRMKKNDTTVDIHQLRGLRFVATSEMPEGAQLDEELVKRVTGGDVITSRTLFESYQSWRANCVVWIATNFLPRLSSDDNAIWRRAKTIPMRTEFTPGGEHNEIEGLADILLQERNGILNWLLDGLASYKEVGLGEPPAISQDISNYRTDMDSVASWFLEEQRDGNLVVHEDARTSTQLLYQRYSAHCTEEGMQPLGRRRFTKRLSTMGGHSSKVGGQMIWVGVGYVGDTIT
jgi:putative DNA primase/helicase